MDLKKKFGRNIAAERIRAGLTQEELAELVDVDRRSITNWETGASTPDILNIYKISIACNCKVDAFYVGFNLTTCEE